MCVCVCVCVCVILPAVVVELADFSISHRNRDIVEPGDF